MNIIDLTEKEIVEDSNLNAKFLTHIHNDLLFNEKKIKCRILKDNFFLDSFNFFPITEDYYSFKSFFSWEDKSKYKHFYLQDFIENFKKEKNTFKKINKAFVLGSSATNNYYRNMLTFIPRIFFITGREIDIVIHRNSSNKFRDFIRQILSGFKIKVSKFIYLDDNFYNFNDSRIPQFFNFKGSISLLRQAFLTDKNLEDNKKYERIYITRKNCNYRNLINEGEIIQKIKKDGFTIIDNDKISILKQIKIFSMAKVIISPTGSALVNTIFCNPGTKILEITPRYQHEYENKIKNRYSKISSYLKLNYHSIQADSVQNKLIDKNLHKYISKVFLTESNYYKDLLIKENDFYKIVDKIATNS